MWSLGLTTGLGFWCDLVVPGLTVDRLSDQGTDAGVCCPRGLKSSQLQAARHTKWYLHVTTQTLCMYTCAIPVCWLIASKILSISSVLENLTIELRNLMRKWMSSWTNHKVHSFLPRSKYRIASHKTNDQKRTQSLQFLCVFFFSIKSSKLCTYHSVAKESVYSWVNDSRDVKRKRNLVTT